MDMYGLTAKVMQGGDVVGYVIVSENGKETTMSKEKVYQMAKLGIISGWELVQDESGEMHLYSDTFSLSNLPNHIKNIQGNIEIIGKLIKNGKHAGYVCLDDTGARKGYTLDKVWALAKQGRIKGVTPKRVNGNRVLISDNHIFNGLQSINID